MGEFTWVYVALMSDHTLRQFENESMNAELQCLKLGYLVQCIYLDDPPDTYEHAFRVKPESPLADCWVLCPDSSNDSMISLYDYRALFNMSACEPPLDEDGYYSRVGFLDIMFPGPSVSMCEAVAQFKLDQIDAIASGVAEDGLMDHFYKKRHPLILQMAKETLYGWFIPRDDPERTYPSTTESALACAMSNALRTDVIVNSERYDSTVLVSLKYHAPYLKFDPEEALKDTTSNIVAGMRKTQVLSAEVDAEIRALPTFVQDTRFYLFADKVALAREANLFACMKLLNETDVRVLSGGPIPHYPGHNECQETCDDVLTEDEWLMIKMADCGKAPEEYPVFPGSPAGIPAFQPPYDPGANPGFPEIPPVMMH